MSALNTAKFLQIIPSTINTFSPVKYLSCALLLFCGSIVINRHLQFKNFTQSVKNCYSILWVVASFIILASLLTQKLKIYKLKQQILEQNLTLNFSNAYFLTFCLIQFFYFAYESYYITSESQQFYFNAQIYPLFIVFLHDVVSSDFVLLYTDEVNKIETKIPTAKLSSFKNLSNYHNNLMDSFENMTGVFAFSKLCSITTSFVTLVFSFYFTVERGSPLPWPISGLFWIILYFTKLCYMAYATTDFNQQVFFLVLIVGWFNFLIFRKKNWQLR